MPEILIVDDSRQMRFIIRNILQHHQFQVTEADNGKTALALAEEQPPDLIISDMMMPEMDGLMLCRKWKRNPKLATLPFILYTAAQTDAADLKLAKKIGVNAYLSKPIKEEKLVQCIQRLLTGQAMPAFSAERSPKPPPIPASQKPPPSQETLLQTIHAYLNERSAEPVAKGKAPKKQKHARLQRINQIKFLQHLLSQYDNLHHASAARTFFSRIIIRLHHQYGFSAGRLAVDLHLACGLPNRSIALGFGLALTELFDNALRYGFPRPEQGGVITVRLRPTVDRQLKLSCHDSGIGLPAAFSLETSPTIGLPLVAFIARELGGEGTIPPTENGTEIRILIPLPAEK